MDVPLSSTPGLKAPPGTSSDFQIHNTLNGVLVGTVTMCLVLTALLMMIRFFVRLRSDKTAYLEDCRCSIDRSHLALLNVWCVDTATVCWVCFKRNSQYHQSTNGCEDGIHNVQWYSVGDRKRRSWPPSVGCIGRKHNKNWLGNFLFLRCPLHDLSLSHHS